MNQNKYFKKKARRSTITAAFSIILVLWLVGLFTALLLEANYLIGKVKENVEMQVFITDDADTKAVLNLTRQLSMSGYFKSYRYIGKDEAVRIMTQDLGEDFIDFVGYNPLKASITVQVKSQYANSDSLIYINKYIKSNAIVSDIKYHQLLLDLVNKNTNKVIYGGTLFIAILALLSFFLISNAIKMNVFAERFTIKSMQLIGATTHFIRKPFLIRGSIVAVLSALIAGVFVYLFAMYFNENITTLYILNNYYQWIFIFGGLILFGVIISFISIYFATTKYLNLDIDELY